MKIGIDGRLLHRKGIGRYLNELFAYLAGNDEKNEYVIFVSDAARHSPAKPPAGRNLKLLKVSGRLLSMAQTKDMKRLVSAEKADLFHASYDHMATAMPAKKILLSVHHPSFGDNFRIFTRSRTRLFLQKKLLKHSLSRAHCLIGTSDTVKRKALNLHNAQQDNLAAKFHTVYNGLGDEFRPIISQAERNRVIDHYGLSKKYFFSSGSFSNHPESTFTMLETYANLPVSIKNEYHLVLAGDYPAGIERKAEQLNIQHHTHFIGFIPENDLPTLYSTATLFLYFTPYEGFETPPLESMACGTPVVTSKQIDTSASIANVAIAINQDSSSELAHTIDRLVNDKAEYVLIRQLGIERAKRFSWKEAARSTLNIYESMK